MTFDIGEVAWWRLGQRRVLVVDVAYETDGAPRYKVQYRLNDRSHGRLTATWLGETSLDKLQGLRPTGWGQGCEQ